MADSIQMHVTRYDPDQDSAPTIVEYEVPLRKDWAILDGLNYVKDHVDGSLSYRWSCRMGICGSCGMNVDGEPKLTCAAFLTDYAPGPVRVEPLTNFPVVRDLVVDIEDFMEKLPRVKPWIIRDDDQSVIDGEYIQTPEELDEYKQFSNCINCMLCYAACPIYGIDETFIGPAAIALAERYDLDSRDRGQRERLDVLIETRRSMGLHIRRRVHPGMPQACRSGRCHPALQAQGRQGKRHGVPAAAGCAMSAPTTYRQPVSRLWWTKKRTYFVFVLRELSSVFVGVVRGFPDGDARRRRTWRSRVSELPELGRLTCRRDCECRSTRLPGAPYRDLVRAHSPGHGGAARWPARAEGEDG